MVLGAIERLQNGAESDCGRREMSSHVDVAGYGGLALRGCDSTLRGFEVLSWHPKF